MIRAKKRSVSAPKELWDKAEERWKKTMPHGNLSRYLQKLMEEDVASEELSSTEGKVNRIVERVAYKPKPGRGKPGQ